MAIKISAERLAKANLYFIVSTPRMKEIINKDVLTHKNALIGALRTPQEVISEQILHNRIVEQLSNLTNPSRIETTAIDVFGRLLKTGADEGLFAVENPHRATPIERQFKILKEANLTPEDLNDLKLINARYDYIDLIKEAKNGERKLIETDLPSIFSKNLEDMERDGSPNLKIVARYYEFLKRALEKNFTEKEMWAHFTKKGLEASEKLEGFGNEQIKAIASEFHRGMDSHEKFLLSIWAIGGPTIMTVGAYALLETIIKYGAPVGYLDWASTLWTGFITVFGLIGGSYSAYSLLKSESITKMTNFIKAKAEDIENAVLVEREYERIPSRTNSRELPKGLDIFAGVITPEGGTESRILSRVPEKEEA